MRTLGKILVGILAVVGVVAVAAAGFLWFVISEIDWADGFREPLPDRYVLHLPLDDVFPEDDPALPFAALDEPRLSVRQVVEALDRAADDPAVVALVATVTESGRAMGQAQELRAAIQRFGTSGKPTIAFADSLGESGTATVDYYLASAFDEVWLQPSGMVALTGFGAEVPFARDAFEDIGITAEYGQRWEYKTAIDSLIRQEMTDAHRTSLRRLMESWQEQAALGIAEARKLPVERVRALMNGTPLFAEEARTAGLVNALGYWDEVLDALAGRTDATELVPVARYAVAKREAEAEDVPKIALIRTVGTIHRGESTPAPLGGVNSAGGDTIARAIRTAMDDPSVRGIVLRVDSPGGSYVASDTVWREVRRARERNLPIVATMGDVAASGGYFVAMAADTVIALPGTVTGSIGVFGAKPVLGGMWDKLEVNWERVAASEHALMWSFNRPFTAAEEAWFQRMLDTIYADFTGKVAEARNLSPQQVDLAARGRIFTGVDALEAGLVDRLGGYPEAVAEVKRHAGIPETAAVRLVPYPEPKTGLEAIFDLMDDEGLPGVLALAGRLTRLVAPTIDELERARIAAQGPALLAPYTGTR